QLAGDEALAGVLETRCEAGADEALFWSAEDIPREDPNVWGKTSGQEDALWRRHVRDPRSLVRLAANPFMLTMLFWLWVDRGGTLPRNRGDLFARFIDALLDREHLLQPDTPDGAAAYTPEGERLLAGLTDIAWTMQGERLGQPDGAPQDLGVLTVLPREAAVQALGGEALLKKVEDATLLEGNAEVRFRHQLLQEYFTASAMQQRIAAQRLSPDQLWPTGRWWERSGWEESAVLLAGLHPDDCAPVIRWLRDAQPEVAAQCILESGAALAIARYPVTHAQFQAFLDSADGYSNERWWAGFDNPNRNPEQARWPISNHPRETVSWFEAMAFCAWLRHRLGMEIRLPTEWEWERAARGTEGRAYPWGSAYLAGHANVNETYGEAGPHYLGQTSAVGIYRFGASDEGVLDLVGNVWEWCLNEYGDPKRVEREGFEPRVVRGGSRFVGSEYLNFDLARAALRYFRRSSSRDGYLGFRVVCASPIR
ncbi:MAG: SUMF1/EgtB/PvdO family nonheme iron enzyme, partial [Chromatiaceae bacterium]